MLLLFKEYKTLLKGGFFTGSYLTCLVLIVITLLVQQWTKVGIDSLYIVLSYMGVTTFSSMTPKKYEFYSASPLRHTSIVPLMFLHSIGLFILSSSIFYVYFVWQHVPIGFFTILVTFNLAILSLDIFTRIYIHSPFMFSTNDWKWTTYIIFLSIALVLPITLEIDHSNHYGYLIHFEETLSLFKQIAIVIFTGMLAFFTTYKVLHSYYSNTTFRR